jgi:D-alanyl-D-alanine carboxypeptidase (penicillin-binding protein 5/6)
MKAFRMVIAALALLPALVVAQTVPLPAPAAGSTAIVPSPPTLSASSYILMDANSGRVLVEHNADERLPPASLTKLMTSYVVSYEIAQGRVSGDDMVTISKNAWSQNPVFRGSSLMWIEVGKQVSLHDLHVGIVVSSGNDASVAVAEYLAGSESAFAAVMNQHAERLGLTNTHFVNSHGLPHPEHYTSARDLAILSRAIMEFPEEYDLYKMKEYTFNNIRQVNRNGLLFRDPTVDGLKTGHTNEAGYCLAASAVRDGMRLISVVMGTASESVRERETEQLLSYGFRYFQTHKVYEAGAQVSQTRIWGGEKDQLQLGVTDDVVLTIPRGRHGELEAVMNVDQVIKAPVAAGESYGELVVSLGGETLATVPLVAIEAVEQGSIFKRIWDALVLFVTGLLS